MTGSLRPQRSGSYLNFEEDPADPASFYGAETYGRLREVKAAVDPDECSSPTIRSRPPSASRTRARRAGTGGGCRS